MLALNAASQSGIETPTSQVKNSVPERLREAQDDAVRLALVDQEEAGLDIVTDGEQRRRHYIWGFLEGLTGTDTERLGPKQQRGGRYLSSRTSPASSASSCAPGRSWSMPFGTRRRTRSVR